MRPASDLSRINRARASSGDNGEEDPPVPISNTEVKLFSAEDTWRETARENRTLPVWKKQTIIGLLQIVDKDLIFLKENQVFVAYL